MNKQGIYQKYIRIFEKLYRKSTAKVKTETLHLRPRRCISKLDWEDKYGITVNGKKLTNLRFSDDIVLFSSDPKNLQAMLLELDNHRKPAGLSINHNKTKIMSNRQQERIMLDRT